jgi:hypothetical protein
MFDTLLSKIVGTQYEIVCDRKNHNVHILFRDKQIAEYHFDKLGNAITFYARLKTNKAVKDADKLYPNYQ